MSYPVVTELFDERIFLAGERVAPGTYVEMETRRELHLHEEDHLPASFNGQVAAYVRKPIAWNPSSARAAESTILAERREVSAAARS